jgi:guanosine-3',5'-bis(diphosphate) 3'-pyrophosphohydrolase
MSQTAELLRAIDYAAYQHRLQRRKGKPEGKHQLQVPYINHPIRVARMLAESGYADELSVLCAAILHDAIEDTPATEADLRAKFGDEITELVLEVTDDKSLPKAERKRLQVEHAPHKSSGAAAIKVADKADNLRDLVEATPDWTLERIQEYFAWARAVVEATPPVTPELRARFDAWYEQRPR